MNKLLVTTALVLVTATGVSATEWTGAKDLTNNLNTIYNSLDGQTQFGLLQSDAKATDNEKNGQLNTFFQDVSKGVTYITLAVDADNQISTGINAGLTFNEIKTSADDLVNRVNYDLFNAVDATGDGYDTDADYGARTGVPIIGNPATPEDNDYSQGVEATDGGLLGAKVTGLLTSVNTVNDFLIGPDITAAQRTAFQTEWTAGTGDTAGAGLIDAINDSITDLNLATTTARSGDVSGEGFYGNIGLGGFTEDNINQFKIDGLKSDGTINDGTNTYGSLLAWAQAPSP